jgi:hypothetical protein
MPHKYGTRSGMAISWVFQGTESVPLYIYHRYSVIKTANQ